MDNTVILDQIEIDGLSIKLVRDDLYPFVGGGSKARKAAAFQEFLSANGYNAVVTCGGIHSNHNRAIALMCERNGWKCHLCIQGREEDFLASQGNAKLIRESSAEWECIPTEKTSVSMDMAMERLSSLGYNPFYIVGGGHNIPGGTCFVSAVEDLKRKCDAIGYEPNYIFVASGTGSTQAGIAVGLDKVGWDAVSLVGISVGRRKERGRKVIVDFANMLSKHLGMRKDYSDKIEFTDEYLMGGYGNSSPEMEESIDSLTQRTGITFEPMYTGKAFYGMIKEIERLSLKDKNILFWHTGSKQGSTPEK